MFPRSFAIAASSMCIGFGIGHIVAYRRLVAQFEQRLEKETAGMREFYQTAKKPYSTPQEAAAALIQESDADESDDNNTAKTIADKVAYHKIVKTHYESDPDDSQEALAVEAEIGVVKEIKHHNLFIEDPHIISQEEFMQNDSSYIQSTLTYYRGDGVLTDDRENIIEELDDTVGSSNMEKFGQNSSDPNVLHIRNGRLQMEFEVCLSDNSYRREVLGIEDQPPQLPSGRKRT
jgi:hypothetical protein